MEVVDVTFNESIGDVLSSPVSWWAVSNPIHSLHYWSVLYAKEKDKNICKILINCLLIRLERMTQER